ncbi:MAG: RES domain-containing protein [Bdellovibrionales bacterium]|nr:RES domain-containing protein [Bdellovibrionales bacterium]
MEIRNNRRIYKKHYDYYWGEYSELAKQRLDHWEEIKKSLLSEAIDDYRLKKRFRAVKWRYSNHPLCTVGSLKDPVGGRFNIGNMNPDLVPRFSALYIAQDKETAEQELLLPKGHPKLSPFDFSLTDSSSISIVAVQGILDTVFDIRGDTKLKGIIKILSQFKFSPALKKLGSSLKIDRKIVKTRKQMYDSISEIKWRNKPMDFDVPSNSQIFGQMVRAAGISGILYKSNITQKECLVIFPTNFKNSSSFIELIDKPPNDKIPTKIDNSNFNICETEIEV